MNIISVLLLTIWKSIQLFFPSSWFVQAAVVRLNLREPCKACPCHGIHLGHETNGQCMQGFYHLLPHQTLSLPKEREQGKVCLLTNSQLPRFFSDCLPCPSCSKLYLASGTLRGFPGGARGKESVCSAGNLRDEFYPWVGKVTGRKAWLSTLVFLPGEAYGQKRLAGYSP